MRLLATLIFTFTIMTTTHAAKYSPAAWNLLPGEHLVFGFKTRHHKILSLALGAHNRYLVYRFGRWGRVELEYPAQKDKSSFGHFKYSSYFRGGGAQNLGLDLQRIHFTHKRVAYEVYCESSAEDDTLYVGVRIDGEEIISVKVPPGTYEGSLRDLDGLLERH